jgi:hypothetical protein
MSEIKSWDFDVKEVLLQDIPEFKGVTGFERDKILINATDKSKLGIVSKKYTVVSHKMAVNTLLQSIGEISKDDRKFEKMNILENRLIFGKNKSTMKLDIEFPDVVFDLGKTQTNIDDIVNFQFTLYNGLTGKDPFIVQFGGNRLVCKNGLTTKTIVKDVRFVHRNIDIQALKQAIKNQFSGFTKIVDEWKMLKNKNISDTDLKKFFNHLNKVSLKNFVHNFHIKKIQTISPEILEKEGRNLWTVANLATNYTTYDAKIIKSDNAYRRINLINNFFYNECLKLAA